MPNLIDETPEARAWADRVKSAHLSNQLFGKIETAVIWSNAARPDGNLVVPIDAEAFVTTINSNPFPLLKGHDPGFPLGKVIAAASFTAPTGAKFIAAVLGLYYGKRLGFADVGADPMSPAVSPTRLPVLPDTCWIALATDPQEIPPDVLEELVRTAPLRVQNTELSHNALEPSTELVRIGLLFMALVWNPLVTTIATEAGKDVYAAIHRWLRAVAGKLSERGSPVIEIQSHHDNCQISFILRGKNVKKHYIALEALSLAAAQAQHLPSKMRGQGFEPYLIVYEFDVEAERWFPSYAQLEDGRLVTDNVTLIAIEKLPPGVSLGISKGEGFVVPAAKK